MQIVSQSPAQTQELASQLLDELETNVITLHGDLGTGKTTFVQGIGKALGIESPITSPTFLLLKSYPIDHHPQFKKLVHLDLYRINSWEEIQELALNEIWHEPSNLILIEWPERIRANLPPHAIELQFEHQDETSRRINL